MGSAILAAAARKINRAASNRLPLPARRLYDAAMKSEWHDDAAAEMVAHYAAAGIGRDLALRVYSSRLLGRDKRLVLHGGGNSSLKTRARDLLGEEAEVLCVKGSGWDMAAIEPAGLPAVRLGPLRMLRRRDALGDEEMVRVQRANLLDPMAPNPSVETLLHAFLPHAYVDHTHATAVLSIADQPDGAARCGELYGRRMALVPYIPPGFALAKMAAEIYEASTRGRGAGAAEARHLHLRRQRAPILRAHDRDGDAWPRSASPGGAMRSSSRGRCRRASRRSPRSRPSCAARAASPMRRSRAPGSVSSWSIAARRRSSTMSTAPSARAMPMPGVVTPDHTIRTKNYPLIVPPPEADDMAGFARAVRDAAARFIADYRDYFARNNAASVPPKRMLDPLPRVVLVPGLGLFGLGRSAKDAAIAADIAENAVETITGAEAIGRFESLSPAELFEMEYWSLEQAKLGSAPEKPLPGPGRGRHRRRGRDRRRDRAALQAGGRRGGAPRHRRATRPMPAHARWAARRSPSRAT